MKPRIPAAPRPLARPLAPLVLVAALLLAGCAAQMEHRQGLSLLAEGKSAEAVESLRRASKLEPDNVRYRIDYLDQRAGAVRAILAGADAEREAGRFEAALQRYREALKLEPGNERAKAGIQAVDNERRAGGLLQGVERLLQANQTEQAQEQLKRVLRDSPRNERALAMLRGVEERVEAERLAREEQLAARAAFRRPVSLQFREAPIRMVFEAIAKAGGVNLVIDREVKGDQRTTILVKDAAIEDTLDVILMQHQLDKRVLSGNTLLIYPATAAKQKDLAELKVRTFQLTNIDATFMASIIKTMIKTKDLVTDAKSNTLVMRDTAESVALAERLVAANDLPDAEVMLEVEVLEISSTRASELGLKLPTSLTLSTPATVGGEALTLGALRGLGGNALNVNGMSATLNLMMQDSDTQLLASPRIRTRNKEKARILVGEKLPVITNLISPQQSGQSNVVTGSIQYVEVGIKLEVEPQVYADGDVGIKLNLEVSAVTDTVQTQSGRAYQIGTRSASTALRLHDGETQVMAGLIDDHDRSSAQRVPGLGQIPVLGRLFSNTAGDGKKSEIVLSITPRIIRPQAVAESRFADAWSGTEANVRDRALRIDPLTVLKASSPRPEAAAPQAVAAPEAPAAAVAAPAAAPVPAPAAAPAVPAAAPTAAPATRTALPAPPAATPAAQPARAAPGANGAPVSGFPAALPRPMPGKVAAPVGVATPGAAAGTDPAPRRP
ncbi:General secretion pathway protein D [Rubrivivax sp. A210]|uniref:secretin N-terminal domain-containing protein n=1 Tax=Rubrivivax sp. A210 TaxID=2772301 RepID=UPI001919EBE2|nr:secretin N-terminal domain-containing protein [Rubrivivax sp. A210]CAD5373344.1 General secretion pathway protein D [Rubrivivax sp. A210]